MKIACISTSAVPATTANSIQVMKVCQSLVQTGHEVRLFVPRRANQGTPPWTEMADLYGLTYEFAVEWLTANPRLKRYDFAWRALAAARRWGADLLYTWLPQSALLALWHKLPAILEVHDLPTGRLGPWLLRRVASHSGQKRLLLITHALQTALEDQFHLSFHAGEALIAPNGIELERYADLPQPEDARRELNLPQAFTALTTGHLYAGRGVPLFLELAARFPQVSFIWVGGRPQDVETWQAKVILQGLTNVTFTGFIPNTRLPLYQATADVLLMPYERAIAGSSGGNSASICSPMKMFDYLATARPILTSDLPVIHEVLNEENAIFCVPEDAESWGAALRRLLKDASLRQRLSARAGETARAYAWLERARNTLKDFPS